MEVVVRGGIKGGKGIRIVSTDADDFAAVGCNPSSGHSDSIDMIFQCLLCTSVKKDSAGGNLI